jgi:hypothetical protein
VARKAPNEFVLLAEVQPEELAGKLEALDRLVAKGYQKLCREEGASTSFGAACFPEHGVNAESSLTRGQVLSSARQARQETRASVLQLADSVERPV